MPRQKQQTDNNTPSWLIEFLQNQEEQRKKDEKERRKHEEERRKAEEDRRKDDNEKFQALLTTVMANNNSNQQTVDGNSESRRIKHPNITRPTQLDVDANYSKFLSWRTAYKDYAMLQKLESMPLAIQRADFRCCLTEQMRIHLKCAIDISDDSDLTITQIMDSIQKYLRQKRNVALDRVAFDERTQEKGETFDEYYVVVRKLSEEGDLCGHCIEQRLTTRIMSGIINQDVRQKLLAMTPFPSLQQVIDICRSEESASKDSHAISNKSYIERINYQQNNNNFKDNNNENCYRCGLEVHRNGKCPAFNSTCRYCNVTGHWASVCKKKLKSNSYNFKNDKPINSNGNNFNSNNDKAINTFKIADVKADISTSTPRIAVKCSSNDSEQSCIIDCIPDTGAEMTICGENIIQQLKIKHELINYRNKEKLIAANDTEIKTLGKIKLIMTLKNRTTEEDVIICRNQNSMLLSWQACRSLGIIPINFPHPIREIQIDSTSEHGSLKENLLTEFSDVFDNNVTLTEMNGGPMKIHLQEDAKPYAIHVARQIPFMVRDQVKKELDSMVTRNIIRPLEDEPTSWCHPMVVVMKPKGGVRICVDLTKLNKYVDRPTYTVKTPKEAVNSIDHRAKYFSTFDAAQGYWQLSLDENSQQLTTFITPYGRYMFLRAPMGLSSTGDEYSRRGDIALKNIKNMQKVVDDTILYDEDFEQHIDNVRNFLSACRKNHITLNPKKFVLAQEKVSFVGYLVSSHGIEADPKKLKSIKEFPSPTNITELRSFMGMTNQLCNFSKEISGAAEPLRGLLSTKNVFNWTADHSLAFENVKSILCRAPTLGHFDPSLPVILQTDASRLNGLGYALMQKQDNQIRLIQCGSRFLSPTEARYSTTEIEMLAVVWAIRKCHIYLMGMKMFTIKTDHRPLISILDKQTLDQLPNPRIQRLREKILIYKFTTEWIRGKDNLITDALSRYPTEYPDQEDEEEEKNINLIH